MSQVRYFVLDEADRMIEQVCGLNSSNNSSNILTSHIKQQGHYAEMDQIVGRLPPPPKRLSLEEKRKKRHEKRRKRKRDDDEEEEDDDGGYDPAEEKKFKRQIFVFSATLTFQPKFVQELRYMTLCLKQNPIVVINQSYHLRSTN